MATARPNRSSRIVLAFFSLYSIVLVVPILFDSAVRRAHEQLTRLRGNEGIAELSLAPAPFPRSRVLELRSVYERSVLTAPLDPYVFEMMVYLSRPGTLLTATDVYLQLDRYYPNTFAIDGVPRSDWLAALNEVEYYNYRSRVLTVEFRGEKRRVIELSQSLPLTQREVRRGAVYAYIDVDAIAALLQSAFVADGGFAFVELPSGERVALAGSYDDHPLPWVAGTQTTVHSPLEIVRTDSRQLAVVRLHSEETDWTYVAGIPHDVFFREARRIRATFIIVAVVILGIGLVVSAAVAYVTSRPLAPLQSFLTTGVLADGKKPLNPFRYLRDLVNESIRRTDSLERLAREQKPFVRRVVIDRLFRGDFSSEGELSAFLEHYGLTIRGSVYGVVCILVEGYYEDIDTAILREFVQKNAIVKQQIAEHLPEGTLVSDVSLNRIGLVVPYPHARGIEEAADETRRLVQTLARALRSNTWVSCILSTGGAVATLVDIPRALQAALDSLDVPPAESDSPTGDFHYYYPPELHMHLSASVLSGKTDEVRQMANQIVAENFIARQPSLRAQKLLAREIETGVIRICTMLGLDSEETTRLIGPSGRTIREKVERLLASLVEMSTVGGAAVAPARTGTDLLGFVHENFRNPEMGLKLLAREFGLSEEYVSTAFRSAAGERFAVYLQGLRMQEARELLATRSVTIDEVAANVGYRSAHAFRRAFKRHFGHSPSAARSVNLRNRSGPEPRPSY